MSRSRIPSLIGAALGLVALAATEAWGQDDLASRARAALEPLPATPPVVEGTTATAERVELGRMLYLDPRLSASGLISCNTCHNLGLAGADLQETSIGHAWQKGPRNAPTVFNAVLNGAQFWDGRARDLTEQAKGPVQAAVEMGSNPERVVVTLRSMPRYVELFARAFPGQTDAVTFDNVARAIATFEATLLTPDAPFDRYLRGDTTALDADAREGLQLFLDKGCAGCHGGVNVGGQGYFPFGVVERPQSDVLPPGDRGRFTVTRTPGDEYVFRAPSLRNVELTAPYFHSGRVWRLDEAVTVMGASQLGVRLTAVDVARLTAFLGTLTGEQPRVGYPVLPASTERTPRPLIDLRTPPADG